MNNVVEFKKPDPDKASPEKPKPSKPPLINLPPITKGLLILMFGLYALINLGLDDRQHAYIILNYGFIPAIWAGNSAYGFDFNALISPLTYIFLHANFTHIMMNGLMLMAFGTGVERWMGGRKFILFFILCGIFSVLAEIIVHPSSENPVIGASGSMSGLFAAILIMLQSQNRLPQSQYGLWPFIAIWVVTSILFAFMGQELAGGQIAWAAHLGGFIAGFGLMQLKTFKTVYQDPL